MALEVIMSQMVLMAQTPNFKDPIYWPIHRSEAKLGASNVLLVCSTGRQDIVQFASEDLPTVPYPNVHAEQKAVPSIHWREPEQNKAVALYENKRRKRYPVLRGPFELPLCVVSSRRKPGDHGQSSDAKDPPVRYWVKPRN